MDKVWCVYVGVRNNRTPLLVVEEINIDGATLENSFFFFFLNKVNYVFCNPVTREK